MPAGEKTEAATPRRREELRQRGQVARSGEVSAVAGLIAGLLALRFTAGGMVSNCQEFVTLAFSRAGTLELGPAEAHTQALWAVTAAAKILAPVILAVCVGGLVGGVSQVGFLFTLRPIKPEFNRLNPLQGMARLFSIQAAAQLGKSIAKAAVVGIIIYSFLRAHLPSVVGLSNMGITEMGRMAGSLIWGLVIRTALALAIIAGLDYAFQKMQFEKSNRMTKPEVKEEYKRTEGDPMVRARRRQRQREIARLRMMEAVRRATAVIANPVHIAVALRYEPERMAAPQVVAKGERLVAERIKEIARENQVPIVENPPLAQALHKSVKIGGLIPPELYQAVAEVLAFVYRISGQTVLPTRARG